MDHCKKVLITRSVFYFQNKVPVTRSLLQSCLDKGILSDDEKNTIEVYTLWFSIFFVCNAKYNICCVYIEAVVGFSGFSLGASIAPHAPPSGFTETYFFLICGTQKEDFDMFPRKKVALSMF